MLGHHLGDLRKLARLVDRLHGKLRRKSLRHLVVDIPTHVEPALRLILELFERLRLYRIDRDSLAGSENADDPVAGNGATLGGKAHRQGPNKSPGPGCACCGPRPELDTG